MVLHENRLPADDIHEMPCLILLFLKKQRNLKVSSAENYRWHFNGYYIVDQTSLQQVDV